MRNPICLTPSELVRASSPERSGVICDYLDVTCSPDNSFVDCLDDWLCGHGVAVKFRDVGATTYSLSIPQLGVDGGTLRVETRFNFHRASASGAFLGALRKLGLYRDYVNVLGSVGHKVTRLDAALDVALDAPPILSALCDTYGGSYKFGRKSVRTKTIFETREDDGLLTGTWYAGLRSKARVSCKVYDKQRERLNRGIITPPQTRYEISFTKDYGASLWDALMPKSIFYTHSSGLIDPPSDGFDEWSSRGLMPWVSAPVDTTLTVEKFSKVAEHDAQLAYLAEKASRFGATGKAVLMLRFEALLDSYIASHEDSKPTAGDSAA